MLLMDVLLILAAPSSIGVIADIQLFFSAADPLADL